MQYHASQDNASDPVEVNAMREFIPPNDPMFEMEIMQNVDSSWETDAGKNFDLKHGEFNQHGPHSFQQPPMRPDEYSSIPGRMRHLNLSPHISYQQRYETDHGFQLYPSQSPTHMLMNGNPDYRSLNEYNTQGGYSTSPIQAINRSPVLSPDVSTPNAYQESAPPLLMANHYRSLSSPPIDDETTHELRDQDYFVHSPVFDTDFVNLSYNEPIHNTNMNINVSSPYPNNNDYMTPPFTPNHYSSTPTGLNINNNMNMPMNSPSTPTSLGSNKKLPYPCRDFINNCCSRGNKCKFMHVKPSTATDTEVPLCRDYIRGSCFRKNCKYLHERPHGILNDELMDPRFHQSYLQPWDNTVTPQGRPLSPNYMSMRPYSDLSNVPASPLSRHISPRTPTHSYDPTGHMSLSTSTLSPHRMSPLPMSPAVQSRGGAVMMGNYPHNPAMNRSYNNLNTFDEPPMSRMSMPMSSLKDPYMEPFNALDSLTINPLTSLSPKPLNTSVSSQSNSPVEQQIPLSTMMSNTSYGLSTHPNEPVSFVSEPEPVFTRSQGNERDINSIQDKAKSSPILDSNATASDSWNISPNSKTIANIQPRNY